MNAERFEELAWAYGGDIRRWPAAEQGEAFAWLAAHEAAREVLVEAGALDAMLNASAPMSASAMLRERRLFGAPKRRPAFSRGVAWLSGAGLAAACAAGVLLGASNASLFEPPQGAPAVQPAGQSLAAATPAAPVNAATPAAAAKPAAPAATETASASTSSDTSASPDIYYGGAWFSGLESEG